MRAIVAAEGVLVRPPEARSLPAGDDGVAVNFLQYTSESFPGGDADRQALQEATKG